ncbi:hypothetical protein D3C80_971890 [compost metagenome]
MLKVYLIENTSERSSSGSRAQNPALAAMSTTASARLITTRLVKNRLSSRLTMAVTKAMAKTRVETMITV